MKWLLITNNGNPGDIWVRLGVQEIIRHFDTSPTWIIRERDYRKGDKHHGLTEPAQKVQFDYSVVCGMPFVWSHVEPSGVKSNTLQHASWIPLNGWLKPEKMIVAGFGIYLLCPNGLEDFLITDPETVLPPIRQFFERCAFAYARAPISRDLFPNIPSLPCPSVLAVKPAPVRDLKLCNFMPGGAHYPDLCPAAASEMESKMPDLSAKAIAAGFHFIAHRQAEEDLALRLGWPKERIFTWKHAGGGHKLLDLYCRCSKYLGNRVHGGIVSRAAGAEVMVIGYDTRLSAVQYLGGQVCTPSTMPDLTSWISSPAQERPYDLSTVRNLHVTWWSVNLRLPIIK